MASRPLSSIASIETALLVALAGFTDVVGFVALHHLFLSFMSGNTTQFAIALIEGDDRILHATALIVGCFIAGTISGVLLQAIPTRVPLVLLSEMICFGLALRPGWLIACAFAMGAQNAIPRELAGLAPAKTFMTGTLVSTGQAIGEALLQRTAAERWHKLGAAAAYATTWTLFLVGGLIGAASYRGLGGLDGALGVGLGLLSCLVASAMVWPHRAQSSPSLR